MVELELPLLYIHDLIYVLIKYIAVALIGFDLRENI